MNVIELMRELLKHPAPPVAADKQALVNHHQSLLARGDQVGTQWMRKQA